MDIHIDGFPDVDDPAEFARLITFFADVARGTLSQYDDASECTLCVVCDDIPPAVPDGWREDGRILMLNVENDWAG